MTGPRAWAGEFVGTFSFVTIASGSVIVASSGLAQIGLFGVATAHGFAFAIMVSVFAAVSGGHLNPAVTLSAWVGRRIESSDALAYVVAQVLGALAAAGLLRAIFTEAQWRISKIGTPSMAIGIGDFKGMLIEAVFTFFLCLAVWGTGIDERGAKVGGFAIGLTLFVSILVAGSLTGAGLNPARFLGPAILGGGLGGFWIYVLGPAIGGIIAAVYGFLFLEAPLPWAARVPAPPLATAPDVAGVEPAELPPPVEPAPRRTTRKPPPPEPSPRRTTRKPPRGV